MQAGRELDELVAQHVLGLQDIWQPFMPSTDIHDAWVVVEKMRKKNYLLRLTFVHYLQKQISTEVGIDIEQYIFWMKPHHICIAALKTVGVDIEKAE